MIQESISKPDSGTCILPCLDLMVAVLAGFAGAYAMTNEKTEPGLARRGHCGKKRNLLQPVMFFES